jgi:hypothetical protein
MTLLISFLALRQEDGALPGDPLPLIEGLIWFLFIPLGISALIWILVSVFETSEKKEVVAPGTKRDILTSIE